MFWSCSLPSPRVCLKPQWSQLWNVALIIEWKVWQEWKVPFKKKLCLYRHLGNKKLQWWAEEQGRLWSFGKFGAQLQPAGWESSPENFRGKRRNGQLGRNQLLPRLWEATLQVVCVGRNSDHPDPRSNNGRRVSAELLVVLFSFLLGGEWSQWTSALVCMMKPNW